MCKMGLRCKSTSLPYDRSCDNLFGLQNTEPFDPFTEHTGLGTGSQRTLTDWRAVVICARPFVFAICSLLNAFGTFSQAHMLSFFFGFMSFYAHDYRLWVLIYASLTSSLGPALSQRLSPVGRRPVVDRLRLEPAKRQLRKQDHSGLPSGGHTGTHGPVQKSDRLSFNVLVHRGGRRLNDDCKNAHTMPTSSTVLPIDPRKVAIDQPMILTRTHSLAPWEWPACNRFAQARGIRLQDTQ